MHRSVLLSLLFTTVAEVKEDALNSLQVFERTPLHTSLKHSKIHTQLPCSSLMHEPTSNENHAWTIMHFQRASVQTTLSKLSKRRCHWMSSNPAQDTNNTICNFFRSPQLQSNLGFVLNNVFLELSWVHKLKWYLYYLPGESNNSNINTFSSRLHQYHKHIKAALRGRNPRNKVLHYQCRSLLHCITFVLKWTTNKYIFYYIHLYISIINI